MAEKETKRMKRQKRARRLIRTVDRVLSTVLLAVVVMVILFCLFIHLEDVRFVSDASDRHYAAYKPTTEDSVSFEELCRMNPDVFGWLTVDDTPIDYPLVQGETNSTYINTDAFGNYALSGALFLDFRNARDMSDPVSIIYGHNMTGDAMFGSIYHFSDPEYFASHRTGTLLANGTYYQLTIFAYFEANGYDTGVYAPTTPPEEYDAWLERIMELAVQRDPDADCGAPVVVLSTCAEGHADLRKLLVATIRPGGQPFVREENTGPGWEFVQNLFQDNTRPYYQEPWFWISILLLIILTILNTYYRQRKRKAAEKDAQSDNHASSGG